MNVFSGSNIETYQLQFLSRLQTHPATNFLSLDTRKFATIRRSPANLCTPSPW